MRQSLELLQAVLDGTTDVIFVKDLTGKYLFINRVGAELAGKTIAEIIGNDDSILFDPETTASIRAADRKVIAEQIPYTYEQPGPVLAADSTFLVTKTPYREPGGEVVGVMGIARDISPHKRAAEVVAQSARRFSTLAGNSPTGIFEADEHGELIYVNQRCCELFEMSPQQILGGESWSAIHPEDLEPARYNWQSFVAAGVGAYDLEARFRFSDGRIKHIVTTAVPLHDEQGNKTGFIGNMIDVTDQRRVQQELERANQDLERRVTQRTSELVAANQQLRHEMMERLRAQERLREQQAQLAHALRLRTLGEMAAELAHEVNQPLSAITNYVHGTRRLLQSGNLTVSEVGPTLDFIAHEAQRAADVIRRAKRFVSTPQPTREPLDLNELVREALKMLDYEARERRVAVSVELAGELPQAAGDALQIQQVIVNLLRNAIESLENAPSEQRRMLVATRLREASVEFLLQDSGPGLQSGQPERIFEAFYTTKPEGLGLGLPISRSIVEAHGGRLWADASSECGATFRFTLPVWNHEHALESVSGGHGIRGG